MAEVLAPVDLSVLPELTGCEPEMVGEFLQVFHEAAVSAAEELRAHLAQADAAGLMHAAHKIKSSARFAGAAVLGDISQQLEDASEAGDLTAAPALVAAWFAEWEKVDRFIGDHLAHNGAGEGA